MFFERPPSGQQAMLLHVRAPGVNCDKEVAELRELVVSADLEPRAIVVVTRTRPHARWFVGQGKAEEIRRAMNSNDDDLLIVNHDLTPAQQRNMEDLLHARVMTRTELILHIFADRARTHEGKLQVELAQYQHGRSRLVRGWTHLDRQKGGLYMRGAGESQLELDQRMIDSRIRKLKERLERVQRQRARSRRRRSRAKIPTIVLVGYTNAGKSSLLNALTDASIEVQDRLFATLDPTMRQLNLDGYGTVVVADTVGFIRDLPIDLVEAFKATLEEVSAADLLLHVVDSAAPEQESMCAEVDRVLTEIGAGMVPKIEVFNKIDRSTLVAGVSGSRVNVSARLEKGLEALKEVIAQRLGVINEPINVCLTPSNGKVRAWLYELGAVVGETVQEDGGSNLSVRLDAEQINRLVSHEGVSLQEGLPNPTLLVLP
ncbi:MAG: GTPase HflX [Pseudomonadota bacterium]|nr:GTPase HflX [Pseudomonadota bacterium]